jgi:hypothetical protein
MVSLALAATLAAAQLWQPQSGVSAQATATVRIVSGESVHFAELREGGDQSLPKPRKTQLQVNGTEMPAWLVEFH